VSNFFFQAEDGIRDFHVTGVQTCALPICVVVCFLPPDDAEAHRRLVERAVEAERATVAFWRSVPVDPSVLSARALASLPIIQQRSEERRVGQEGKSRTYAHAFKHQSTSRY